MVTKNQYSIVWFYSVIKKIGDASEIVLCLPIPIRSFPMSGSTRMS